MTVSNVIILLLLTAVIVLSILLRHYWLLSKRISLGIDEIAEDALKEIYHLSRETPEVRRKDVIRTTNLQPGQYSIIQAELERRNWISVEGESLRILRSGEKEALRLIRAHRIWERYLADKEGLELGALHEEATRREHRSTPDEIDQLDAQLGYPKFDPHGDPIPARDGELSQHAEGTPLSSWPEHVAGRVAHVEDEPPALFAQLAVLGVTPGAYVEVDERTPGQVLVWSGRKRLSLATAAASLVSIVPAPAEQVPLSELDIGQAAPITSLPETIEAAGLAHADQLKIGTLIAAVKADPLGDPVTYRVDSQEVPLSRVYANQILVDAGRMEEIVLPRRSWLAEQLAVGKELFLKYGSAQVIKRTLLFMGPAFIISVGYMDPGNWGTDIEGGARFGYALLWVILMANMMAILMQILSAKLGIATGRSLPEVSRDHYPRWLTLFLWFTAELAAIATDLAEFLGGAVGFNLLFGIPLFPAAILTGIIISLILLLERYGIRKVELVIIFLIAVIGLVYMVEILLVKPPLDEIARGLFIPTMPAGAILVAVGIIGATVMPHNLYLHSSLIQSRVRPSDLLARKKSVFRLTIIDSAIALNGAFFVNAAILIMSATVFAGRALKDYSLETAHQTLVPILGPLAATAFAVALLASGLASSTTATMAGQVIIEGFLHRKINVWLRRLITMVPSLIIIGLGIDPLRILILSQVSLSFQLPFAMIPLVLFTSNSKIMGEFTNTRTTRFLAWLATAIILGLNAVLLYEIFTGM